MLAGVCFDLDGTLLDTVPDIRVSLNRALSDCGFPEVSYAQTIAYVGNGARKLVERAAPQGDHDRLLSLFAEYYNGCDNALTRPYPGMAELLLALKARGVKLAVVTNKLQRSTERLMEKFFPGVFDFVGGDSGMFPVKPDPTLARYAALSLRIPMNRCAFVGDGETDVSTARNAGMVPVSVLWGYRTRAELEAAGAPLFAEDPTSLQKILWEM